MVATLQDAYDLFHRGTIAFAEIEATGIKIDTKYLHRTIKKISTKIQRKTKLLQEDKVFKKWKKTFREKTKLSSRDQLGHMLFKVLKYPVTNKTPTGKPSADDESLSKIGITFTKNYLEIERLKKAKTTYLEGILREVVDGFLHPSFNLNTVVTFRSSSSDPNFHNIPVRDPKIGPMIRRAFIPRKGNRLIEPDFGALEFAGAACFWKDKGMVEYASDPKKDIHGDTAAKIFGVPREEVSKMMRYIAKNMFVFPILYGSYYIQCARNIWQAIGDYDLTTVSGKKVLEVLKEQGITKQGACNPKDKPLNGTLEKRIKECEDDFNKRFPGFGKGKEVWVKKYRETGGFRLMTGFPVRGVFSRNFILNCPIQGPCFHLLLWSLVELMRQIKKKGMKALIVGQIHDCLYADVPEEEVPVFLKMVKKVLTVALRKAMDWVIVPMKVEIDVTPPGGSWADKEPWVETPDGDWIPKAKT